MGIKSETRAGNSMNEAEIVQDFLKLMVELAREEGRRFEVENGRKPTEQEAERISEMILRQARTAVTMVKQ